MMCFHLGSLDRTIAYPNALSDRYITHGRATTALCSPCSSASRVFATRGAGTRVLISDCDPICVLQACMEVFPVARSRAGSTRLPSSRPPQATSISSPSSTWTRLRALHRWQHRSLRPRDRDGEARFSTCIQRLHYVHPLLLLGRLLVVPHTLASLRGCSAHPPLLVHFVFHTRHHVPTAATFPPLRCCPHIGFPTLRRLVVAAAGARSSPTTSWSSAPRTFLDSSTEEMKIAHPAVLRDYTVSATLAVPVSGRAPVLGTGCTLAAPSSSARRASAPSSPPLVLWCTSSTRS